MATQDLLKRYGEKRDFTRTPEPETAESSTKPGKSGKAGKAGKSLSFVIQKHAARNLHYDFRLELEGTLKSWAVPKGPSLDPSVKRMGVHVEDHPLAYASFEGRIPPGQYGAGDVIVWDRGQWLPVGDPAAGLQSGKLKFELLGEKLRGGWTLVRMQGRTRNGAAQTAAEGHEPWLLIKEKDEHAREAGAFDVLVQAPDSVLSGQPLPAKATSGPSINGKSKISAKPAATKATPGVSKKPAKAKNAAEANALDGEYLPEGAHKAALPARLAPQLATLLDIPPPETQGWVYEIKFDGYRLLTRIDGDSIKCFTRNGHDWTARLQALAKAVSGAGISSGWLDGEMVVMNEQGIPDFGALQNAFDNASTANIVYFVFDIPYLDGLDLRQVKLAERREILRTVLTRQPQENIRFSEAFEHSAQDLLASAGKLGLEGVIGKRADSSYASGRSRSWIKLKTQQAQEFVIGGYTAPKGSRSGLGALMLGVHDASGQLRYAGNVGTGFNDKTLASLQSQLAKIHSAQSPFADAPAAAKGQWVKPELLAEVAFGEWTSGGKVRHAVFKGLRSDKPAKNIQREAPAGHATGTGDAAVEDASQPALSSNTKSTALALLGQLRITHPDRVIDPSSGFTKKDLIAHYAAVASLMLPHLKSRPTSLVRAPTGITGELFFQKHAEARSIPGIQLLDPALDPGHAPLLEIPSAGALLEAAQMNVIEFHTWNAVTRSIHQPDRMTFDLDPGEGVGWTEVQEAARLVRTMLDELQLTSFLKTSGGKGLHVVVPLQPAFDFDTVKDFSHAIVDHLARVVPQRFVAKSGPKNRVGKIFVDYLRNGFGATTVAAWSVRARPGLGVSVPVGWDELDAITSGAHWSAGGLDARLSIGNEPWFNYQKSRHSLSSAMKQLGFKPVKRPALSSQRQL
jgi:bifunctional non-homologous end joining protein LigD